MELAKSSTKGGAIPDVIQFGFMVKWNEHFTTMVKFLMNFICYAIFLLLC